MLCVAGWTYELPKFVVFLGSRARDVEGNGTSGEGKLVVSKGI